MTVPVISKHARAVGTSPTVAGLIGKQLVMHLGIYLEHMLKLNSYFQLDHFASS